MIYILLVPALMLLIGTFGYPLFRYSWLSLHSSSVMTELLPIANHGANWQRLISDERFWQDALQTLRFSIFSVGLEIILALAIALLLHQSLRFRGLIRVTSLLPWALPTTVMALGWRWIFNTPYGPIEQLIKLIGLEELNILSNPNVTWIATIIGDVWKTTPFIAIILLAGLQTIPKDLYEAFNLEGGNPKKAFINITLPLLRPYLLVSVLFRLAQAFGVFDIIQIMTGGGPASSTESLALYAYLSAMRFLDFGYSSTIMMGSFLLLITGCFVSWFAFRKAMSLFSQKA